MKKPTDVTYWLDDRPPLTVILLTTAQQIAVMLVFLYPAIVIAREARASPAEAAALLSGALLACGLGTLLQATGRWGVGSGFLGPSSLSAPFLPPALLALHSGGLAVLAGMTLLSGLFMIVTARALHRIRSFIPPEVVGAIAFIIGFAVCVTGARTLLQTPADLPPAPEDFGIAAVTLTVAGGLSVWAKGLLRWTCVLVAMAVGSAIAMLLGRLEVTEGFDPNVLPIVGLPSLGRFEYAFDLALAPAFMIASLAVALKTVGLVTTLQKLNDADWVRPEPRQIAGGVAADGVATAVAGMIGGMSVGLSTTNVMVQRATGITSRVVAYGTAAACLLLACFPRAAALLSQVPAPVLAAVLLYSGSLMLVNAMQVITSRMLDVRKSLAVGLALVTAVAVEVAPQVASWVSPGLRSLVSATALGTLVAIVLNAVLRIGVRQRTVLEIDPLAFDPGTIEDFADARGAAWGARRDVIRRTGFAMVQAVEAVVEHCSPRGPIRLEASFDEFNLDIRITYAGDLLDLPDRRPSGAEIRDAEDGARRLAGYMLRRNADRVAASQRAGTNTLHFHFDH